MKAREVLEKLLTDLDGIGFKNDDGVGPCPVNGNDCVDVICRHISDMRAALAKPKTEVKQPSPGM